jgi:hypothetical protein
VVFPELAMPEPGRRNRVLDRHARLVARRIRTEACFHEARVLVLIAACSADGRGIPDLEVLARLDFLLRFPSVLDRVPEHGPVWPQGLAADPAEHQAVMSAFYPAHYGLWLDRYLFITGTLVGRRLISVPVDGNSPKFVTRESGQNIARRLASSSAWYRTAARADHLHGHLPRDAEQLDDLIRPVLAELPESNDDLLRLREPYDDVAEWSLEEDDGP